MEFKKFVNEDYLNEDILEEMKKSYLDRRVLKLDGFLKDEVYDELVKMLMDVEGTKIKVADKYSYSKVDNLHGLERLFLSREFLELFDFIIDWKFEKCEIEIRKFKHGDYTLLHDSDERKGIEFIFIFTDKWDDSFGGQIIYTDNLNKGRTFIFSIKGNSLILIDRERLGRFVKYVNNLAGDRGFFLIFGRFS